MATSRGVRSAAIVPADAALRADPEVWQAELSERALWDTTLLDGLEADEQWTGEGDFVSRAETQDIGR